MPVFIDNHKPPDENQSGTPRQSYDTSRRSSMRSTTRDRTASRSHSRPRWLIPGESYDIEHSTVDEPNKELRPHLRFADTDDTNFICKYPENTMSDFSGVFGAHHKHEVDTKLPERIQQCGLSDLLDEMLKERSENTGEKKFNESNKANDHIKQKQNRKPILQNTRLADLMNSMYLKPGVIFEGSNTPDDFTPQFKLTNVSKTGKIEAKFSLLNTDVEFHVDGVVVDLIGTDFRSPNHSLIEANIFSNLLRNSVCYNSDLKPFIGRNHRQHLSNDNWKSFYMDPLGYLRYNELSIKNDSFCNDKKATNDVNISENELNDGYIHKRFSVDSNKSIRKTTATKTPETNNSAFEATQFKIDHHSIAKFPSTSHFYKILKSSDNSLSQMKMLSNWFTLPPFCEFLNTPVPPTPPRRNSNDQNFKNTNKGRMNPENILACDKCLLGDNWKDNFDDSKDNDTGIMGEWIFIKGEIDIEELLWENVETTLEEKVWRESKIRPDYEIKKARQIAKQFNLIDDDIWNESNENNLNIDNHLEFLDRLDGIETNRDPTTSEFHDYEYIRHGVVNLFLYGPQSNTRYTNLEHGNERYPDDTENSDWSSMSPDYVDYSFVRNPLYTDSNVHTDNFNTINGEIIANSNISSDTDSDDEDYEDDNDFENENEDALTGTPSVASGPSNRMSRLLYSYDESMGTEIRRFNKRVYAADMYTNRKVSKNLANARSSLGDHNKGFRKSLLHNIITDDKPSSEFLEPKEREKEKNSHLKLSLLISINRRTGAFYMTPGNISVNLWSVLQNDGELFTELNSFNKLWEVFKNDDLQEESDKEFMKDFKDKVCKDAALRTKVQKLLFLHGITNASILNNMISMNTQKKIKIVQTSNFKRQKISTDNKTFTTAAELPDFDFDSLSLDGARSIQLKPKSSVLLFEFC
ncbi:hypothetical protein DAMA08_009160 [Martiniozyma asiatica (nom. inval.)]|nr:hypothetical protein DAMA08_009160 [Martiniozyma asiatica]